MKIFKESSPPTPWYEFRDIVCWHCQSVFRIEESDVEDGKCAKITMTKHRDVLVYRCPVCSVDDEIIYHKGTDLT